jgi:tRNA/rRNA methyltransferase
LNCSDRISIILVRPQIAGNVGFTARSMKAFGFRNLALVNPEFPLNRQSPACKTASGAHDILDSCRCHDSLSSALQDMNYVYGFSRREHDLIRPKLSITEWIDRMQALDAQATVALLFGSEDFGLLNEDKKFCDALVYIPLAESTLSLNLSHAITIVLYELYKSLTTDHHSTQSQSLSPPVTVQEQQRLHDLILSLLQNTRYLKPGREEQQSEAIRHWIQRFHLTKDEYHAVIGFVQSLTKLSR